MKDINYVIIEEDIKNYLKQHKDDENIKYREAMFVKYMREQRILTEEALEIMMKKYNFEDKKMEGIYFYDDYDVMRSIPFRTFDSYLDGIKNLDISGICHILIPALGYYGDYQNRYGLASATYLGLNALSMRLIGRIPEDAKMQLERTLENYEIADKISCGNKKVVKIHMGKDHCRKELQEYSYIYGEEPVKVIRKKIRERMK